MLWLITKFNVFLPVPGGPFVPFVPRTPESYSDSRQIRWRRVGWDKEERYMIWTRCTHRWRYSNQLKTLNVHISGPVWARFMKLCTHRPILGRNKWTLMWTQCIHRWRYSDQLKTLNVHISCPVWARILKLCTHIPLLGRNNWTLTHSLPVTSHWRNVRQTRGTPACSFSKLQRVHSANSL